MSNMHAQEVIQRVVSTYNSKVRRVKEVDAPFWTEEEKCYLLQLMDKGFGPSVTANAFIQSFPYRTFQSARQRIQILRDLKLGKRRKTKAADIIAIRRKAKTKIMPLPLPKLELELW